MELIIINKKIKDIKLESNNEGQKKFFSEVMATLDKEMFSAFILNSAMKNAGGYFTDVRYFSRIVLPEKTATYNKKNHSVKFANDEMFGIFIHEACHYLHIKRDKGRFISKELMKMIPFDSKNMEFWNEFRTECEYEAGWRSIYYNRLYKMVDEKIVKDLNIKNMTIYLKPSEQLNEFVHILKTQLFNKNVPEDKHKICEETYDKILTYIAKKKKEYLDNIDRFSELSSFKFPYYLTEKDETKLTKMVNKCLK